LVDARLPEIADRLAAERLAIRSNDNRLLRFADSRQGRLARAVGLFGAAGMVVSGIRSVMKAPDSNTLRRMYEAATGVDRDRARDDLAFVSDRLAPCVIGDISDEPAVTIKRVALALLMAAAYDDRRLPAAVDQSWNVWIAETDIRPINPDPAGARNAGNAYIAAWESELVGPGSPSSSS
jgi:hypothetical protein